MWRPKDWDKVAADKIGVNIDDLKYCDGEFEAGADAMLGELFKLAKESPTGTFTIDSRTVNIFSGEEGDE